MAHISYKGWADNRSLSAKDLAKFDVDDFKRTVFPKGEAVEVSDQVAEVLLGEGFAGEFERAEPSTEDVVSEDIDPAIETGAAAATGDTVSTKTAKTRTSTR